MARSGGITFSAVVVFLGSSCTALFGIFAAFGFIVATLSGNRPQTSVIKVMMAIDVVIFLGLAGWGIATGVGLIRLKRWARISLLIFSGLLAAISSCTVIVMALMPLPQPVQTGASANLPPNFLTVIRISMVVFYATLAILGGVWLWYFNKRSVKAQFGMEAGTSNAFLGSLPVGTMPPPAPPSGRPVSLTVIGWFLVIGPFFIVPSLAMWDAMGLWRQIPFYFLGMFLFGWSAVAGFISFMIATMTAGFGVLKLKYWGWLLAMGVQLVGLINGAMLLVIPAHRERFQQAMEASTNVITAKMMPPGSPAMKIPVMPSWVGLMLSIPIVLVVLYFLITRKKAFYPPDREAAPIA